MTDSSPATCPRCGASASGNFCAACGSPLGPPACINCGTPASPGARFCHKCGASLAQGAPGTSAGQSSARIAQLPSRAPTPARETTAWIVAALLVVAVVAGAIYSANHQAAPQGQKMTNAGNAGAAPSAGTNGGIPVGRAPNIENMSPKERFARLEARITQALQGGDSATVINFTPMALAAYAQLPDSNRDIDAQYHAAMLEAQVGMFNEAVALSDTILKKAPGNLFGYYIRATTAEFAGDSAKAKAARAEFRSHYDAEIKKNRPEYAEHRPFLEQYRTGDGAK